MSPRALRDPEAGFSLPEIVVVSAILSVVFVLVGGFMWSSLRTTTHITQTSDSVDESRLALARVERDIRGAQGFSMCNGTANDDCLKLPTIVANGQLRYIRYKTVTSGGTSILVRDVCDSQYLDCDSANILEKLDLSQLPGSNRVFNCRADLSELVRIGVIVPVAPLVTISGGTGVVLLQTSARPRNLTDTVCA